MDVEIKFLRIERDKLRAEVERLTAEKSEAIQAFAEQVRENERLQAKVEQLEGALAESCDENRSHVLSEGPWSTDMCPIAGKLSARVAELEGALFGSNGALTRMDRARKILNDRHGFDKQQIMFLAWNVLNTDDIKAALKGDT